MKRILLVEYEPRYLERLRALLPPPEFQLIEARDGEEGLAAFSGDRFDLVVLSGMLPRMPSGDVIREIRRKGGATAPPILLMMSGYKGSNPKADAQKIGAFDIVPRPFSDEALLVCVREALESTDLGARTMRIDTSDLKGKEKMTSSDIFSDVLEDLQEPAAPAPEAPAPTAPPPPLPPPPAAQPPARAAGPADDEIERRLRDTLSGILDAGRPTIRTATPPAAPAPPAAPTPPAASRFSADADIDRMLTDTLSGLTTPHGPKATPPPREAPPREPPASSGGPDRFGQYEIVDRIASGGMAELYKAKQKGVEGFQKTVAIKKILPHLADNDEFIAMFADEAKLAAQLNHPNIIHIYDLGKIEEGGYFIAMEYVEGRDLRAILQSGHEVGVPLPVPLAVYIASKVASALDYAHRRRDSDGRDLHIVHRDVSPPNILISYEGDIKLCDFGIAKAASKASQTESGALKGKLQYMSPEQAWGKAIDRRSDLFSLGTVLHEMLTGERLFQGDSDLSVLEKVRRAEIHAPSSVNSEISASLDAVVLKALAREAEERYANAAELLRDLDAVLYSYSPAPGSADVAIYLHRLQAEETAAAEAKAREAEQPLVEEPARRLKAKGAPLARKTSSEPRPRPAGPPPAEPRAPLPPAPPPAVPPKETTGSGVFGAFSAKRVEAEKKRRAPLYAAIAAAVVVLGIVVYFVALRKPPAPRAPAPKTEVAPLPTAAPSLEPAVTPPPPADAEARPLDSGAIEREVQRQLAQKRKELQKALETTKAAAAAAAEVEAQPTVQAPVVEPEPLPTEAPPLVEPTLAPTEAPTPVPEAPSPRPTAVVPPPEPQVARGDLVGPGPGVVEPSLVAPPRVIYPSAARQQRISGRVIVLVLVNEEGRVTQARLQSGVASRTGVNEAVVDAVRQATFRPATKNGIPVKMWRTVVVDVKP
jgi:TonB family protein